MEKSGMHESKGKNVALFVTCLVDMYRPSVAFSCVSLLKKCGFIVGIPPLQVCCGQPAFNSGDQKGTRKFARNIIKIFENFDYVVAPSGSCTAMIKKHYPNLFVPGSDWHIRAETLAGKVYEITQFLNEKCDIGHLIREAKNTPSLHKTVTIHDSCSGLRELGIKEQPRALLHDIQGIDIVEAENAEVCCGFGGTFCLKYSEISNEMVTRKIQGLEESGSDVVVAIELGCLMNIAGKLSRKGSEIEVRHVVELLDMSITTAALCQRPDNVK